MRAIALLLTLAVAAPGAAIAVAAPGVAVAQGFTPYETYTDPLGGPATQPNLTPLADDTALLGPAARLSPPWLGDTRPPRDFDEIADPFADYWEWRTDRLRQIQEPSQTIGLE